MSSVPGQISEITAEWLSASLPTEVRGGAVVTAVDAEVVGEGIGFLSQLARLRLTYDRPGAGLPSVIAKLPTLHEGMRQLSVGMGFYARELGFYRRIARHNAGVRIPECYFVDGEPEGDFVMLLEDMAPARPGDQVASCSVVEAETAITEVAKLHARWWQSPQLAEMEWLPGAGHPFFDILDDGYRQAIPAFEAKFAPMFDPEILRLATMLESRYRGLVANLMTRQLTLVHQDFRLDNMFFSGAKGGAPFALIDWQLCQQGVGPMDVAYFLAGNLSPEIRRAEEKRLLELYWETLRANGVDGYTLDDCWNDYRLGVAQLLFYLVTAAPDFNLEDWNERGQLLFERMYHGYASAILDHDVGQILAGM